MSISQRVKNIRKTIGLSQKEFAEKIGVKQASVSLIESGGGVSTDVVKNMISELNVNSQYILEGTGEMFLKKDRNENLTPEQKDIEILRKEVEMLKERIRDKDDFISALKAANAAAYSEGTMKKRVEEKKSIVAKGNEGK